MLDEFHLLQQPAAATLLKTIEEPTASTTFLVLADDVPPELVTIASRCVRVEFGPVPDDVLTAALEAEGAAPQPAALAATAARGNIDRARLLVRDPALAARHHSWYSVPARLDGTGATVAVLVDELLESIDDAAAPLLERHKVEIAALEELAKQFGERGSGRRLTEERQRRELRRHRTDELKAGLATLASAYRDRAIAGERAAEAFRAVAAIHEAVEAMERNPNETLLMQALLLKLSS